MKAAQISRYGSISEVSINDVPRPALKPGHVLVEVHASSLNPADTGIREGAIKDMISVDFPFTLCGDVAGIVKGVAGDVTTLSIGDKVYGQAYAFYGDSGALAQYASVHAGHLAPIPKSVDLYQAGSLPLVGVSAVQALEDHARLRSGQKVLVHGGAGSVGTLTIQLAKHIGAYVATTASADNADFVRSLGADEIIDYKTQDFSALLKDYDVVIDLVANATSAKGGGVFEKSLSVLKPGGTIVSLVAYFGQDVMEDAKRRGFNAVYQLTKVNTASLTRLAELVDAGVLVPRIGRTFKLDDIREAFRVREAGKPGKVIIRIR